MTTATPTLNDEDLDVIVEGELDCHCEEHPDYPCDNEFTGVDGLCDECRPKCFASVLLGKECCGSGYRCKLVPLLGTDGEMAHVRKYG